MIANLLLPGGLAFIMFALGLTLQLADFNRILKHPFAILLGLFCQLLLLPVLAFTLLHIWPVDPLMAVGIMILAASPGGITSNLITHFARGDTALSISLTAISSLAGLVTIPLIIGLSLSWFTQTSTPLNISPWKMVLGIFTISTLPVLIGMTVNQTAPAIARKIQSVARPASVIIFALIVIGAFAAQWQAMMVNLPIIGLLLIVLNISIMLIGYGLAITSDLGHQSARAISMEGGLQNGAVGIFIATSLLANPILAVASITYALVMNITAGVFILILQFGRPDQQDMA